MSSINKVSKFKLISSGYKFFLLFSAGLIGGLSIAGAISLNQPKTDNDISFTSNTSTSTNVIGSFDSIKDGVIGGWTLDKDNANTNIEIHVYVDKPAGQGGKLIKVVKADKSRPDVNKATGLPGNHGFSFRLPFTLAPQDRPIYIYGINIAGTSGSNVLLAGSPKSSYTPTPIGYFDGITNKVARGWALDPESPFQTIDIHFYADGEYKKGGVLIGSVRANKERPDVNQVTGFPGNHGFEFAIPSQHQGKKIYAYGINLIESPGDNRLLSGSPK